MACSLELRVNLAGWKAPRKETLQDVLLRLSQATPSASHIVPHGTHCSGVDIEVSLRDIDVSSDTRNEGNKPCAVEVSLPWRAAGSGQPATN
jgi:hypothetical protein